MSIHPILAPAAVLILWSVIVLLWLAVSVVKAFTDAGIKLGKLPHGGRLTDLEKEMPPKLNWVHHNFNHLMAQPTLFYAVIVVLALSGDNSAINLAFAWGYTVIRIAHSIWQCFVNIVSVRFALFQVSNLCLLILAINAVRITIF